MTDPTTTTAASTRTPVFESPDGRVWERDVDHHDAPMHRFMQADFPRAFAAGTARAFEHLGAPLVGGQACVINGWSYLRMVPAGAPDKPGASKLPPPFVFKVLSRLHPELRRRDRIARAAVADEVWMDDVRAWWEERPDWQHRFSERQRLDLSTLDDTAVAAEIEAAHVDAFAMLTRHFELITPGAGIGLALNAAGAHGIAPTEAAEALRGCSRSTSSTVRELASIRSLLDPGPLASATTLDDLRSAAPAAAARIDGYLETYGWRVLGDDVAEPTLAESPDVLLRSLRAVSPVVDGSDPIADLVAEIPVDDRARVEGLLRRAGEAYEMLDDNSGVTCWGLGVLRRAALEGGRRLVSAGRLDDVGDVWFLDADELGALLRGAESPSRADVVRRRAEFDAAADADPPDALGGEPGAPPDPSVFPSGLRAITTAVGTYLSLRFPPPTERADSGRVEIDGATIATGHGVGSTSATGRAVVAHSPEDAMDRLEPGDVLVCTCTNPAYNAVFPIAGAVVTAVGGPLGHTAVTAREVGIPAVVGIGDLGVIADGSEVTVIGG